MNGHRPTTTGERWDSIQTWLFPALEDGIGELDAAHRQFVVVCELCTPQGHMAPYRTAGPATAARPMTAWRCARRSSPRLRLGLQEEQQGKDGELEGPQAAHRHDRRRHPGQHDPLLGQHARQARRTATCGCAGRSRWRNVPENGGFQFLAVRRRLKTSSTGYPQAFSFTKPLATAAVGGGREGFCKSLCL